MPAARFPLSLFPLWPPIRDPALLDEQLRLAEANDPVGHSIHLVLALLFCAFGGVATSTLELSATPLILFSALRLHHTWRTLIPLLRIAAFPLLVLFASWSAITLLWSLDAREGLSQLHSMRMILIIPALWPLMHYRRMLAGALVIGMCVAVGTQALDALGVLEHRNDGLNRYTGLASHPGHLTLWLSMAAISALALLRGASTIGRIALTLAIAALTLGAFAAGGRGSLLGLGLGALVVGLVVFSSARFGLRHWLLGGAVALGLAATVIVVRGDDVMRMIERAQKQLNRSEETGDPRGSAALRLYWWGLAFNEWRSAPLVGTGSGSWKTWATAQPDVIAVAEEYDIPVKKLILAHPHSVYLQVSAEMGLVGLLTLLAALIAAIVRSARRAVTDPVVLAGLGSLAVWIASSSFEGNHISPRGMAPLALAVALSTLPTLLPVAAHRQRR